MKPFQAARNLIARIKDFQAANEPLKAANYPEYDQMIFAAKLVADWLTVVDLADGADPAQQTKTLSVDPDRLLANYKTNEALVEAVHQATTHTDNIELHQLLDQVGVQLSRYNYLIDDIQDLHGEPFSVTLERPEMKYKGEAYDSLVKWLDGWIKEHDRAYHYHNSPPLEQIVGLIRDANDEHKSALTRYKRLVDDLLTYLRACVLVAEGVGKGGTHHIKEIRLESLIEQIETVIEKLRDEQGHSMDRWWRSAPDLFRNEYPVLEYIQRARKAEEEAQRLRDKYEPKPKVEETPEEPDYQF